MESLILTLFAETFIHVGAGKSEGAIDLPVNREATTNYPYIPGSGVKGALRDKSGEGGQTDTFFGKAPEGQETGNAGALLIGDARLLLLPVRSLNSTYKWLTCPSLLQRFARDLLRSKGKEDVTFDIPKLCKGQSLTKEEKPVYLEEFVFDPQSDSENLLKDIVAALKACFPKGDVYDHSRASLEKNLVIISDEDFDWYARYGLPVNARNQLTRGKTTDKFTYEVTKDDGTKEEKTESGNLWYEETLAPDTLMYMVMSERVQGSLEKAKNWLNEDSYLLMGGNETVGQGWFSYHIFSEIKQHEGVGETSEQTQLGESEVVETAAS